MGQSTTIQGVCGSWTRGRWSDENHGKKNNKVGFRTLRDESGLFCLDQIISRDGACLARWLQANGRASASASYRARCRHRSVLSIIRYPSSFRSYVRFFSGGASMYDKDATVVDQSRVAWVLLTHCFLVSVFEHAYHCPCSGY